MEDLPSFTFPGRLCNDPTYCRYAHRQTATLLIFPLLKAVDVFLHLQLQRLLQETTDALSQKRIQHLFGLYSRYRTGSDCG